MAIHRPLTYDNTGGVLRQMTDAELTALRLKAIYTYGLNPSVVLSRVGTGGNLGSIYDTRSIVNGYAADSDGAPPVTIKTIEFSNINQTVQSELAVNNASLKEYPVYLNNSGDIVAMTDIDFYDTIILPAIDTLTSGNTTSQQPGTYFISATNSVAGATLVDPLPIYIDTRADLNYFRNDDYDYDYDYEYDYEYCGPYENDRPIQIQQFYLHQIDANAGILAPISYPLYITDNNNLKIYGANELNTLLEKSIRYTASANSAGLIRYSYTDGNTRGSAMSNTVYSGSGFKDWAVADLCIPGDYDYDIVQQVPAGPVTTANIYNLRIKKG